MVLCFWGALPTSCAVTRVGPSWGACRAGEPWGRWAVPWCSLHEAQSCG